MDYRNSQGFKEIRDRLRKEKALNIIKKVGPFVILFLWCVALVGIGENINLASR